MALSISSYRSSAWLAPTAEINSAVKYPSNKTRTDSPTRPLALSKSNVSISEDAKAALAREQQAPKPFTRNNPLNTPVLDDEEKNIIDKLINTIKEKIKSLKEELKKLMRDQSASSQRKRAIIQQKIALQNIVLIELLGKKLANLS